MGFRLDYSSVRFHTKTSCDKGQWFSTFLGQWTTF